MGLDIAFSRIKAKAAGFTFVMEPNGDDESIAYEKSLPKDEQDAGYIAWLEAESELVKIPQSIAEISAGMAPVYVVNDSSTPEMLVVRANPWGSVYAPLTHALSMAGIKWTEF